MKTYLDLLNILISLKSDKERKDVLCDGEFLSKFDVTQEQIEDFFNHIDDL